MAITKVMAKDEGDFYFLFTLTDADEKASKNAGPYAIVPFDPDRVYAHGSLEDAKALAAEHGVPLEVV